MPVLLFPAPATPVIQIACLAAAAGLLLVVPGARPLVPFAAVLAVVNAAFLLTNWIGGTPFWRSWFTGTSALAGIESTVALKPIGILPVLAVLLLLLGRRGAHLQLGNLSSRAEAIPWLGIRGGRVPWGRLAWIAGLLIALGTFLLTLVTSTGFTVPRGIGTLLPNLHKVLLLALVNSLCEGIVYRNAILGPLKAHFPKTFVVVMSALFFGIAHYTGIPGGPLGSVMSGLLGWFMARSMYETDGLASAWIIHLLQDVTIFGSVLLFG